MIDLNKQTVNGNCPKCNKQFTVTLGQVSKQEIIKCSSCKEEIKLIDNNGSTQKGIKDINKSFKELERTFKKLGRKR